MARKLGPPDVNVVLLMGPPASGKSTLGRHLESCFGYKHFDIGAYVRANIGPNDDLEEFAVKAVEKLLNGDEQNVLLNGFPKYVQGLKTFGKMNWVKLRLVIVLQAPDHVLRQRAAARHGSGERPEDNAANFEGRLLTFSECTLPVLDNLQFATSQDGEDEEIQFSFLNAEASKETVEAAAAEAWARCRFSQEVRLGIHSSSFPYDVSDKSSLSNVEMIGEAIGATQPSGLSSVTLPIFSEAQKSLQTAYPGGCPICKKSFGEVEWSAVKDCHFVKCQRESRAHTLDLHLGTWMPEARRKDLLKMQMKDEDLPKMEMEERPRTFKPFQPSSYLEVQKGSSSLRRDPDEADLEVVVCLMSGEERMRPLMPRRSSISTLRRMLVQDGETDCNLIFFYEGRLLNDSDRIATLVSDFNGFVNGTTIQMVREKKPPPPPVQHDDMRNYYKRERGVCFTHDSIVCVRGCNDTREVQIPFSKIAVGDFVRTDHSEGIQSYRRVQRVWAHKWGQKIRTFELAKGCRVTTGHPVMHRGQWTKPEDIKCGIESFEEKVYQLEIEGHVDTVVAGGIICALLGRYCGPEFGWNVFTRKTVKCDKQPCTKCSKAFMPGLSFDEDKLPLSMLPPFSFPPY
eukprot:gnl/MRDRNA2_/MRDRNA2_119102_c0_seq1.p1 gnl/MRDRNA2_/MRDRNA2_119102_c0~~gnl/MRDRNA2_/MRDRNA2_119102_c0_seq1.p1  ORF type:complete len:643 (+),score=106.11 gnl/MRDRNA2_/MRDRNA2_119102_c0_seq1:52-1929(+)